MNRFLFTCIILVLFVAFGANAFYLDDSDLIRLKEHENADITDRLEFYFDKEAMNGSVARFPDTIKLKLNVFNKSHLLTFNKIENNEAYPIETVNVYTIDKKTNRPFIQLADNQHEFALYKQQDGNGIATLVRNYSNVHSKQPFKLV